MAQSFKVCPICKTLNHASAMICSNCGTSLGDIAAISQRPTSVTAAPYDFRYGENDLMEASLPDKARTGLLVLVISLVFGVGLLGGIVIAGNRANQTSSLGAAESPSPRPSLGFATVTMGPPTQTHTPTPLPTLTPSVTGTPTPCTQTIVTGGSLIAAILGCGYDTLDIMPTVMALNNITDAGALQLGQEIIIPWPSPTFNADAATLTPVQAQNNAALSVAMQSDANLLAVDSSIDAFAPTATATLPSGVMWHTVQSGDNVITISMDYNANAKTLSELNPEIDFARCEFGERFGGPECLVQLGVGQIMRVPAPTALPTASPTLDPNATATPTATPTYNEPTLVSPSDRQFFAANDLITLRWVASATLRANQQYLINVTDTTSGITYQATTSDILFLMPLEWQGRDSLRHSYEWNIAIVDTTTNQLTFQTASRNFVWQGYQETTP